MLTNLLKTLANLLRSLASINNYVAREIRKACRADGTNKSAGQPVKQISESDPGHQAAAAPAHDCGNTPAENNHALADLVWKYFSEEITQVVIEVQEALAPAQIGATHR